MYNTILFFIAVSYIVVIQVSFIFCSRILANIYYQFSSMLLPLAYLLIISLDSSYYINLLLFPLDLDLDSIALVSSVVKAIKDKPKSSSKIKGFQTSQKPVFKQVHYIAFDIETYINADNQLVPYAIGFAWKSTINKKFTNVEPRQLC